MLYFLGESEKAKGLFEADDAELYCSVLSFFEVKKGMERKKVPKAQVSEALDIMRRKCIVVQLTEELCIKAAEDSIEHNLYAIDSLIYRSAADKAATLVTADPDFHKKKLKNVLLV